MSNVKITVRSVLIEASDSDGSEFSDRYDKDDLLQDDGEATASVQTPLSSVSSKSSPKYPSQLKTQHCPYPDCSKSFNRRARLNEHLHSHTNTRPFKCPHPPCEKDFLRKTHLSHHVKSTHSDVRDYLCAWDGCGKVFLTGTRLKRHHAAHEGREKFKCSVDGCGQTFRKHATLQKHTTSVHEGRPRYVCEKQGEDGTICGAGFETAAKLKTHHGRVHGTSRFWCTLCTSNEMFDQPSTGVQERLAFTTYGELQTHNRTVHPPSCETCNTKFQTLKELKRHVEAEHGDLDPLSRPEHICTEPGCGRSFTKKGNLIVHTKTVHAGEKAFVCGSVDPTTLNNVSDWLGHDSCGRAFTTKKNLEEHIRTAHLGLEHSRKSKQNPKKNKVKRATEVGRLTGTAYEEVGHEIPCLRAECEFRFAREYDLDMHLQSKHGLADFEIQIMRAGRDEVGQDLFRYGLSTDSESARVFEERLGLRGYDTGVADAGSIGPNEGTNVEDELDEAAARGGEFWIGANYGEEEDEWESERERERIMMLIDGDIRAADDDDKTMIDPVLR